jgi:hypothetical protein
VADGGRCFTRESVARDHQRRTRSILRTEGARAFIVAMARNLPCLRHRVQLDPWDAMRFRASTVGASHGERCAVQFVLSVWNYRTDWDDPALISGWIDESGITEAHLGCDPRTFTLGKFDVIDALGVWDEWNRAGFIEWAKNPIWP